MKEVAVIGVGSPFGFDDIGKMVIDELEQKRDAMPILTTISLSYEDRPSFKLIERIKQYSVIHFIDAIMSNSPLGTLHRYEDIRQYLNLRQPLSTHDFGLAAVLHLGYALGFTNKKLVIHGIEINYSNDERLSGLYQKACHQLSERLFNELLQEF